MLLFHLRDNPAQRCAQRFRYSSHIHQSNVASPPLNISDITSMYLCTFRQLFLRQTPTLAYGEQFAQMLAEDRSLVCASQVNDSGQMLIRLQTMSG